MKKTFTILDWVAIASILSLSMVASDIASIMTWLVGRIAFDVVLAGRCLQAASWIGLAGVAALFVRGALQEGKVGMLGPAFGMIGTIGGSMCSLAIIDPLKSRVDMASALLTTAVGVLLYICAEIAKDARERRQCAGRS